MRVVGLLNNKGGVGKSTLAIFLAKHLALRQVPTLLIDMDPQCSSTYRMVERIEPGRSVLSVLRGQAGIMDVAQPVMDYLSVVPSTPEMFEQTWNEYGIDALRRPLQSLRGFAAVVIDCQPGMGPLPQMALAAATDLIVPTLPSIVDVQGLADFVKILHQKRQEAKVRGVLLNQYHHYHRCDRQAKAFLDRSGVPMFGFEIMYSVVMKDSLTHGLSVEEYAPKHKAARQVGRLGKEVTSWLRAA